MLKYSQTPKELLTLRVDRINRRWGQLYELEKEWGEKAIRYLLLTNSGGAIATLGFLGASEKTLNLCGAKISLFLFVAGLILVGISTAKQFHHMSNLFSCYKKETEEFMNDQIPWEQFQQADIDRAKDDFLDYAIPYASFFCFFFGCIVGGISLF